MGDCKYCGASAGFLRGKHKACETVHQQGWSEMVAKAAASAQAREFNAPSLRADLAVIAERSYVDPHRVDGAIAEGWRQAVSTSLADGILTRSEEERLREFRDRFAIAGGAAGSAAVELEQAVADRLSFTARQAALTLDEGEGALEELSSLLDESELSHDSRRRILVGAWEAAVEELLEDTVLSLEETSALVRYMNHFGLSQAEVDANGAHKEMVKGVILREVMEGELPERIDAPNAPFNLQKSEKLIWVVGDVEYYQTKVRRIRQGTSQGVSIRVARGLYYRPSTFRSEAIEREETVHADTGLLGVTSKHLYFHGARKRFRIRYDKIVSFDAYSDGIGVMRDTASAKPEAFLSGDGWFIYNLVTNLAQQH